MKKLFLFVSFIVVLSLQQGFAQTIVQEAIQPKVQLKAELVKEKADNAGTDVSNIYTIVVKNEGAALAAPYVVVYSLDGQVFEAFRNQPLPFSFKRNFKGQTPGRHELKIFLEGQNDVILGSETFYINVVTGERP